MTTSLLKPLDVSAGGRVGSFPFGNEGSSHVVCGTAVVFSSSLSVASKAADFVRRVSDRP